MRCVWDTISLGLPELLLAGSADKMFDKLINKMFGAVV